MNEGSVPEPTNTIAEYTSVGPHPWRPRRRTWRQRLRDWVLLRPAVCDSCYLDPIVHPTQGYTKARPMGWQ